MSPAEKTRKRRRAELYGLLGDLPDRRRKITVRKVGEETREYGVLEKLSLDLNGFETVPAYFLRPLNYEGRLPAILYNHAHGLDYALGKDELLRGRKELYRIPYAEVLLRMGFAVLCIDHWGFGERWGRTEAEIFKEMLWKGQVMWGMMVYDSLRAFDYLSSRPEVDAGRITTLGLSMGSIMSWWVAALEPRIRACIDICDLTDFQAFIDTRGLDEHGIYFFVPRLLKHFTTAQINALIAPRPHLGLAGNYDRLTPAAGLDRIDVELKEIYAAENAPDAWKLLRYNVGHFETAEMRAEVIKFLEEHA